MVLYFIFFFVQFHLFVVDIEISLLIYSIYIVLVYFILQITQFQSLIVVNLPVVNKFFVFVQVFRPKLGRWPFEGRNIHIFLVGVTKTP